MIVDRKSHSIVFDTCHDTASMKDWRMMLDENYTKEQLINIISLFEVRLPNYSYHMSGSITRVKFSDYLKYPGRVKKGEITDVLAGIFAEKNNRAIIHDLLTPKQKQLWIEIFTDIYVSADRCKDIFGKSISLQNRRYYYRDDEKLTEDGAWLKSMYAYSHWDFSMFFYLPAFIRRAFVEQLLDGRSLGKELMVPDKPDQPEVRVDFENSTLELLPLLNGLYMSGKIESGRFRVSLTVVKRLAKQLKIQEFECDKNDDTASYLRTMMLINAYSLYANAALLRRNKVPQKPHVVVRSIYKMLMANTFNLNGVLLSFLDKSIAKVFENSSVKGVFDLLTGKLASSKGQPIDAVELFDALYFIEGDSLYTTIFSKDLMSGYSICNTRSGVSIGFDNFIRQLTVPTLLAAVAMLASIGIVEVTYAVVSPRAPYALSGLRSVRLTPLGAYAMELTETYVNEVVKERIYFEAEEDSLVIRAIEENNPYEGMMSDYCRSIGARRWILTSETFLAKCSDKDDLLKKITDFRNLVGITLPAVYDDFFKRLVDNCSWSVNLDNKYALFRINPEATELLEAIVSDPEIRRIVVRAEGYFIMVPVSEIDHLSKCFARYGYIL